MTNSDYESYSKFLIGDEFSLFYYSIKFKSLLERLLGCKSRYFVAKENNGEIVGAFPIMLSSGVKFGTIANSLPYYGSHGSFVVNSKLSNSYKEEVKSYLLDAVNSYIREKDIAASTFISNLFFPDYEYFNEYYRYDYKEYRTGQVTYLPTQGADLEARLMNIFQDPRPRNIRKAIKSGVTSRYGEGDDDFEFLQKVHYENITEIGGLPKTENFFKLVPKIFSPSDYRLYVAEQSGNRIAALLLFYFNRTVEYFTPVVVKSYRTIQPLSLLIFEAMKDAVRAGYRYWNWGGTWSSQKGVYDFKKRWGAKDYPYFYFIKLYNKRILNCSSAELLKEYPGFFIIPFDQIGKEISYGG